MQHSTLHRMGLLAAAATLLMLVAITGLPTMTAEAEEIERTPAAAKGEQVLPDDQAEELNPIPIPLDQRTFPQFVTTRVDNVVFSLGFRAAQVRMAEGSPYVPLVFGMQNFKHKLWSVKMDDFQLYDEHGERIEPISLKEIRSEYRKYQQDYLYLSQTATADQLLPNAEFAGGVRGEQQVPTVDIGTRYYGYTSFYPIPGRNAVRSVTLDYKNFFFDILYYKDIAGKWMRLVVPGKERRPQLELVFKVEPAKGK